MSFYTYKFRIYPSLTQIDLINRTIGCSRFIYNYLLADCKAQYETTGKLKIENIGEIKKIEGLEFLKEVDSLALCNARLHLQIAYQNFFRNLKRRKITFPKFKSKRSSNQSYTTNNVNSSVRIEHKGLRLPKLGFVNCKFHRFIEGKIKAVTVSRTKTNKYFVSILVDKKDKIVERIYEKNYEKKILGIDMSLPNFAIYSDGTKPKIIHYLRNSEKKLAKEQKILSRKIKDSKNYEKQKLKVAKIHEKIANQRKNFIEEESTRLSKQFDVIVVEDINLQTMSKSLNFGKTIHDNGFGYFRTRLECKMFGQLKEFIKADRWFASSKTCNICGDKKPKLFLSERKWCCPKCKTVLDRDLNAAINLKNYYIRLQQSEFKPMEISSVDDRSRDLKKHLVDEVGKIVSMETSPKSQAFCFS